MNGSPRVCQPQRVTISRPDDLCRQGAWLVRSGQNLSQPFGLARAGDDKGYVGGVNDDWAERDAPRAQFVHIVRYHPSRLFVKRHRVGEERGSVPVRLYP
jgi:hypothetical protein